MHWLLNVHGNNTLGSPCRGICGIESTVPSTELLYNHLRIMVPDISNGDTMDMIKCLQTVQQMHVEMRNRLQYCILCTCCVQSVTVLNFSSLAVGRIHTWRLLELFGIEGQNLTHFYF